MPLARTWGKFLRFSVQAVAAAALGAALPAAAAPPDPAGGVGGPPLAGSLTVRAVASGGTAPIAGAMVLVGPSEGAPFAGNVAFTDAEGEATFSSPTLAGTVTVTAGAPGRAYVTVYELAVSQVVLPLPTIEQQPTARLGDQFAGIEVNNGLFCIGDGSLDLGIVLAAVPIDEALAGGAALTFSAASEPLSTPQGPVPVPGNLYFPRQCELAQYFEKSSYHARVPTGRRTLFGLSARAPLSTFLSAATFVDLIKALTFREMDVLRDVSVSGDSDGADLNADLPLTANMTLQISNGQPGTAVLVASGGRVTAPDGQEELVLTGAGAFDPDTDGAAATLTLATRPAAGDLSDLVHAALVTQQRDTDAIGNGHGSTTALARSGMAPPVTRAFSAFFDIVEIASPDDVTFGWTDVTSPSSPSTRHLSTTRLVLRREVPDPDDPSQSSGESRTYWILHAPGGATAVSLPELPVSAPVAVPRPDATPDNDRLDFSVAILHLGDDPDGFSYDAFAFRDAGRYGTHVSTNERPLRCATRTETPGLVLAKDSIAGRIVLSWSPSADYCHDTLSGIGYAVHASPAARPAASPGGAWPSDPPFANITGQDLDGSLSDATFTYAPPEGDIYYLVVDRGLDGAEGPSGHYGSAASFRAAP